MRTALVVVLLLSCAPSRSGRPCPAAPAPTAEAFTACGGMVYHTPPGGAARYSIKFVNAMDSTYELRDVCILLDGLPLFTAKDIEAGPKDVKWDGRISYAQHRVQIQVVFKTKKSDGLRVTVRSTRDIATIDSGSLEITAYEEGTKPAIKMTLPKDTPEPKCDH